MFQAVSDFIIKTQKGNITIKAGQVVALPEDIIKTLLKKGKIKGAGIPFDTLSKIHLDTARSLAEEKVDFGLSTPEIRGIEENLNQIWLDCLHGRATLTEFKAINRQWAAAIRVVNEKAKKTSLF